MQYHRGSLREESGSITYDEIGERVRFLIREEDNGQEIDAFEVIALYLKVQCTLFLFYIMCNSRMWSIVMTTKPNSAPTSKLDSHLDQLVFPQMPPHTGNSISVHQVILRRACWSMFLVVNLKKVKLLHQFQILVLFVGRYETTVTAGACIPVNDIFARREGDRFEETVTE